MTEKGRNMHEVYHMLCIIVSKHSCSCCYTYGGELE